MNEWIKCSDKMPDLYQWVLVCDSPKGTNEPRCINIFRWKGEEWDSLFNTYGSDSPTYSDIIYNLHYDEVTRVVL